MSSEAENAQRNQLARLEDILTGMERSALRHGLYDHASEPGNPVLSYQDIREKLQLIRLSLRTTPFVTGRSHARSARMAPFVTGRSQARSLARAARTASFVTDRTSARAARMAPLSSRVTKRSRSRSARMMAPRP